MTQQIETTFTRTRCYNCGTFWCVENSRNFISNICPVCAGKRVKKAEAALRTAMRSANALRGILKRRPAA